MNEMVAKSIKTTSMMLMEMQENLNVVTLFKVPIIGILEEIDPFIEKNAPLENVQKNGQGPPPCLIWTKSKRKHLFSQENVPSVCGNFKILLHFN